MTDQYLMERNGERMNVTLDKYQEYLDGGWKVLKTPQENRTVVVQDQPVVPIPDVVAVETDNPTPDPSPNASHSERGDAVSADGEGSKKTRGKKG